MEREEEELESFWPTDKHGILDFREENKLQTFMLNVNNVDVAELPTGLSVPVPTHLKGLAEEVARLCVELEEDYDFQVSEYFFVVLTDQLVLGIDYRVTCRVSSSAARTGSTTWATFKFSMRGWETWLSSTTLRPLAIRMNLKEATLESGRSWFKSPT